jgi:transposase
MRVSTQYRTVILQAYPDPKQERVLKRCEQSVLKFLEVGRLQLQKMLYHKLKDLDIGRYSLSLLAQRFTGSMGEKALLPFHTDYNARFVEDGGLWFIDAQLLKGRGERVRIPIAKTEVPYYESIQELVGLPFFLARENDKWFAYVSVPVKADPNGTAVGIDFNLRLWVASPYEDSPLFFDARPYSREVDRLQKLIARAQKNEEDVEEHYQSLRGLIKQAHGNFLSAISEKWGICTLVLEDIETMYGMRGLKSKLTNNWLYKKTALRQFALRAMAKGFDVVEVPPRGTSKECHRCGSQLKIYGRHERLVECDKCGLRDYNRDLNAARNIAKGAVDA